MARTLITVPASARRGEVFRPCACYCSTRWKVVTAPVPTAACCRATSCAASSCSYNGERVVDSELFPAVAANPYLEFSALAVDSGTLRLRVARRQRLRTASNGDQRGMRRLALWLMALLVGAVQGAEPAGDGRRSGFDDMGAATQAMQRDDSLNPGMLWVLQGESCGRARPVPRAAPALAATVTRGARCAAWRRATRP